MSTDVKDKINETLDAIGHAWNYYLLAYRYFEKKLNYDPKVNYVADILEYFNDTLDLLHQPVPGSFGEHMMHSIGVLQIVYVQQDLTDELLKVFKLPASSGDEKRINRNLRNELVGHPIRRREGKLVSSVLFNRRFRVDRLQYVVYHSDHGFQGSEKNELWEDIINRHFVFLKQYLFLIKKKIDGYLRNFGKELKKILNSFDDIPANNLVKLSEQRFETIFKYSRAFDPFFLTECVHRKNEHPRFGYLVDTFVAQLRDGLQETVADIDQRTLKHTSPVILPEVRVSYTINIVQSQADVQITEIVPRTLGYEFSKLYDNHPLWGIDYFLENFGHDPIVVQELEMMRACYPQPLYFCCYYYLKYYMSKKGLTGG